MQRRHDGLLDALENIRHACRQIVVQQHRAGIKIGQAHAITFADQGLQREPPAARQLQRGGLGDLRNQRTDAHDQPGLAQDVREHRHVLQIEGITRVVLRHQQQTLRIRADFFHRAHRRMHRQR